jgi:hypothetical protein
MLLHLLVSLSKSRVLLSWRQLICTLVVLIITEGQVSVRYLLSDPLVLLEFLIIALSLNVKTCVERKELLPADVHLIYQP